MKPGAYAFQLSTISPQADLVKNFSLIYININIDWINH